MNIIISNSSGRPIYEQITSQLKQLILTGELKPHEIGRASCRERVWLMV